MNSENESDTVWRRRGLRTGGMVCLLLIALLFNWKALSDKKNALTMESNRFQQMRADAARIMELRQVPQVAVARRRPSDSLLRQVEDAVAASGIHRDKWLDSIPQPDALSGGGRYRRLTTLLVLHEVSLRQLASLSWELQRRDKTLSIAALEVSRGRLESGTYTAEVSISYDVFAPNTSVSTDS